VAGRRADGKWHIEVAKAELGTAWIVGEMVRMRRWSTQPVVIDQLGAAASLIPALTEAGVDVKTISGTEYGAACGLYYDEALAGRLHHIDQTPLTAAVQGARSVRWVTGGPGTSATRRWTSRRWSPRPWPCTGPGAAEPKKRKGRHGPDRLMGLRVVPVTFRPRTSARAATSWCVTDSRHRTTKKGGHDVRTA
jgi:hypothetical protein